MDVEQSIWIESNYEEVEKAVDHYTVLILRVKENMLINTRAPLYIFVSQYLISYF